MEFFTRLKRIFTKSSEATPVPAVLARIMKRAQYLRLKEELVDRRDVIEVAAKILGLGEADLLYRISARLKIPFTMRVPPLDPSALQGAPSLRELRNSGAIALNGPNGTRGFVCCDPALLKRLGVDLSGQRLFLSSWSLIAQALDETERRVLTVQSRELAEQAQRQQEAAVKVLRAMLMNVERFATKSCRLSFSDERIEYSFVTAEGKAGAGLVAALVREPLLAYLKAALASGLIELPRTDASALKIVVTSDSPELEFFLDWGSLDEQPGKPEQREIGAGLKSLSASPTCAAEAPALREEIKANASVHAQAKIIALPTCAQTVQTTAEPRRDAPLALLVDDNQCFARVLERFLARHGLDAVYYEDAAKALSALHAGQINPALIICDLHMPQMDGFQFLQDLRVDDRHSATPVIMLTSDNDVESELKSLNSGADLYLTKTVDPRVLCAHAQRLTKRRKAA